MTDLVKALNEHVSSPKWNENVANKLEKMVEAVSSHTHTPRPHVT